MRALVQCVSEASIDIEGQASGTIGRGYVILLGVGAEDAPAQAERLWQKISKMRVFEDEAGKTNLSLGDVEGDVMIVSQFTLYANCKKGNRPSFTEAARPETASPLYEHFVSLAQADVAHVVTGQFGAMMDVHLSNHGPFTIWLDTDNL